VGIGPTISRPYFSRIPENQLLPPTCDSSDHFTLSSSQGLTSLLAGNEGLKPSLISNAIEVNVRGDHL
jgi:hypothetical protein